jgi:iron complex outermembrane receptor protein
LTIGGSISRKDQVRPAHRRRRRSFDVLNTTGFNTTFPSIKTSARGNVGWSNGPWSADAFANYTGSYYNWSGTTQTRSPATPRAFRPAAATRSRPRPRIDLHLSPTTSRATAGWATCSYIDGNNIFDKDPVFYNNANGYDTFSGNPIGRMISVGFRAKY